MFISEFLGDAYFGLAFFTLLVHSTLNYSDKINSFTLSDGDRLNWFETILQYYGQNKDAIAKLRSSKKFASLTRIRFSS